MTSPPYVSSYWLHSRRSGITHCHRRLRVSTFSALTSTVSHHLQKYCWLFFYILFLSYDGGCGFRHRLNKSLKKVWPCVEVEQFKVHLRQTPAAAVVGEGSSMMKQRLQENPTFFILMWVVFIYLFIYSSLPVSGGCLTWGRRLWGRVVWPFLFSSYMNMNLQ